MKTFIKLTKRQQEILDLIREEVGKHGSAPTRVEIAKRMGFRSANAAEDHLRALARKGMIELVSGTSRGIRLKTSFSTIPLIEWHAACKAPSLAKAAVHDTYLFDQRLWSTPLDYLIQITQDIPHFNLLAGDQLAVRQADCPKYGDRVLRRGHSLEIQEWSESLHQKILQQEWRIEGIVVGLLRTLPSSIAPALK